MKKSVVPTSRSGKQRDDLSRFATEILGALAARVAGAARSEGNLHPAEAKLRSTLNDRLAIDAAAVDEGAVGGSKIDEVPDRTAPEKRRVRARDAVVGDSNIVLRAAADVDDRSFDGKTSTLERTVAQDLDAWRAHGDRLRSDPPATVVPRSRSGIRALQSGSRRPDQAVAIHELSFRSRARRSCSGP